MNNETRISSEAVDWMCGKNKGLHKLTKFDIDAWVFDQYGWPQRVHMARIDSEDVFSVRLDSLKGDTFNMKDSFEEVANLTPEQYSRFCKYTMEHPHELFWFCVDKIKGV